MKKLFVFIMMFSFVNVVLADDNYCTVISGNGSNIGDEISCGTEYFYVIGNDGENIKMLSKYNLYVGSIFDKTTLDINQIYVKKECMDEGCTIMYNGSGDKYYFEGEQVTNEEDWENKIKTKYHLTNIESVSNTVNGISQSNGNVAFYSEVYGDIYEEDNKKYKNMTYKLYPYVSITEDTEGYALQNGLALGVTGEKGNANYPLYATLALFPSYTETGADTTKNYNNFINGYTNFDFNDGTRIKGYLDTYKLKLSNMGYNIFSVDMINIKEINDFVYSISNKNLPLSEWYNASINTNSIKEDDSEYYNLGDLKEYLSDDYEWLWNTTYWTKTFVGNYTDLSDGDNPQVYFVSSSGEICYSKSDCNGIPRAGIRPVVTISSDSIIYSVDTKTDGNGVVKVSSMRSKSGKLISFKITPNDGYVLDKVEVTDSDGNVLTFTDYSFTMPDSNVLVEVTFKKNDASLLEEIVNPQTGFGLQILTLFVILVLSIAYIVKFNKKRINNNIV